MRSFKLGHIYSIEYDDHFSTERTYRDEEDGEPCRLRARGVLTKQTKKILILEHSVHTTDRHKTNKRADWHGIVRSCIVSVQEFGKEK